MAIGKENAPVLLTSLGVGKIPHPSFFFGASVDESQIRGLIDYRNQCSLYAQIPYSGACAFFYVSHRD